MEECAHCREIAQFTEWLGDIARTENKEYSLPDAEKVWQDARILALQAARERALRPLVIAKLAVGVALALMLAGAIAWISLSLPSIAAILLPEHLRALHPMVLSVTALITCSAILLSVRLLGPVLTET
jgi:hypothetical protein